MTTDVENNVLDQPATEPAVEQDLTQTLQLLQQAIASMPAIDAEKVQAVINKLQNGSLNILGSEQERLESAKKIAQQIINESAELDE